jgi:hypothetical protein
MAMADEKRDFRKPKGVNTKVKFFSECDSRKGL